MMPTHFHGIFFHEQCDPTALAQALTDFREFTARQLADFCQQHLPNCFAETLHRTAGSLIIRGPSTVSTSRNCSLSCRSACSFSSSRGFIAGNVGAASPHLTSFCCDFFISSS